MPSHPIDMPRRPRPGLKLGAVKLTDAYTDDPRVELPAHAHAATVAEPMKPGDGEDAVEVGFAADGSPNAHLLPDSVVRLMDEGHDVTPENFFRPPGDGLTHEARLLPLDASCHAFELERAERCFSLGRHKSNSLRVADSRISGLHCTVSCDTATDAYFIQDHSHNGTWLQRGPSKWLLKRNRVKLQDGDIISVISCYVCPSHGAACVGNGGGACFQLPGPQTGPSFRFSLRDVARADAQVPHEIERPANPALRQDSISPEPRSSSRPPHHPSAPAAQRVATPQPPPFTCHPPAADVTATPQPQRPSPAERGVKDEPVPSEICGWEQDGASQRGHVSDQVHGVCSCGLCPQDKMAGTRCMQEDTSVNECIAVGAFVLLRIDPSKQTCTADAKGVES